MVTLGRDRLFVLYSRGSTEMLTAFVLLLILLTSPALCRSSREDLLFNIVEEQSIGTYIGAITDNQYLFKNLILSQRKQLKYGLLDQTRYPASLFRVDESSGGIYVANRIDRESDECYQQPTCILEFNVALSSSRISYSNIATVLVTVADKNDNPPYFPAQESGSVVLDISEFASVGTVLKLSGAADRDYDKNNTVHRYALTAYNSVFSIKSSSSLDDTTLLDLTLLQPLDREVISGYRFSILAFDGGSPPLSAALAVQIRVTDENDNGPKFLNDMHYIEIRDEVEPEQVILQVSAIDIDSGKHGQVHYQFSRLQREQLEQKFHVDEVTGEISVVSELYPGTHRFIVEALDGGRSPLKSETVVMVKVISSKNNPPSLQINTLSNSSHSFVEVPEDATLGAFLAFVTIEDNDKRARGGHTCYLDSDILQLEAMAGKGYKLTLHRALDRETRNSFNVTVTCSGNGQPPLSTSRSLQVIVTDVNDNPPKFTRDTFSHTLPEGNYSNSHVMQITATDPDMGKNAQLIYSIDSSTHSPFKMDPVSGVISATGQLDRETTPVYTFKMYAADRGESPRTASANVIITLEDINDQYPTFNKSIFKFHIPENAPNRTLLGTLSAYDYDKGNNGKFEFFYTRSLDGAHIFRVSGDGMIWTSRELDREHRDSYSFTVMVRDKGLPPKTTYANVVVTVLDVNDNAPRIQFPVSANHTIHVSTVPELGMVLVKIVAYDPDAAENGSLNFVVLHGNEDGALDIDPSGGEVKVKDVSKLKNKRVYRLAVGVEDQGSPSRSSNTTILVDIDFDRSNGVMQKETEGEAKAEYVIIVACVASSTVFLSAIIIFAICFILRHRQEHRYYSNHQAGIDDNGEFSSIPVPHGNMYNDKNLRPSLGESADEKKGQHTLRINKYDDEDNYFNMKQSAIKTFRNSQRKKEVSFASTVPMAEEGVPEREAETSMSHTYCNVKKFTPVGCGEKVDNLKHNHRLLPRQADEVGSDTSGDTGTTDSGRGSSEDDANIDHTLHGERDRQEGGLVIMSSQPSLENDWYSEISPSHGPKDDPHKTLHIHLGTCPTPSSDSVSTSYSPSSRSMTPSLDSVPGNRRTMSFSPSGRCSLGSSLFTPRTCREGSFSSSANKDVSFTPLSQHSPQRTLSTFSSLARIQTSFSTFRNSRTSSQRSAITGDDTSTTTSDSYTVNPE